MARYQIEHTVVDTTKATAAWECGKRWDGKNHICLSTGSQWDHQLLYRSRRGRYYVVSTSWWEGSTPYAEWISPEDAVRWLALNNHEIPQELRALEPEVIE